MQPATSPTRATSTTTPTMATTIKRIAADDCPLSKSLASVATTLAFTDDDQLSSLLIDRLTRPATHLAQLNPITSPPSPISIPLPDITPSLTDELFPEDQDDLESGASSPSPPLSPMLTCADADDDLVDPVIAGPELIESPTATITATDSAVAPAPAQAPDTAPSADSESEYDEDDEEDMRMYRFTTAPSSLEAHSDDDDDEEEDDFPTIHHCPYRWIFTPHPTMELPTIEFTPAPTHPASNYYAHVNHTPLQNSAFNNRLTVPFHTALNSVHPPMVLNTRAACVHRLTAAASPQDEASPCAMDSWAYIHDLGHWIFRPPGIRAQIAQGMFSVGRGPCLGMASRRAWEAWEERDLICTDDEDEEEEDEDELIDVVEEDDEDDEAELAHTRVVERVSAAPAPSAPSQPQPLAQQQSPPETKMEATTDPAAIPCPASPPLPTSYHIDEDDEPLPDPVW